MLGQRCGHLANLNPAFGEHLELAVSELCSFTMHQRGVIIRSAGHYN